MKQRIIALAIGIHFFFVIAVATHLDEWIQSQSLLVPIAVLNDYYSTITFTNRNFGFFAPDVTSDWNILLVLTDSRGQKRTYLPLNDKARKIKPKSSFATSNQEMNVKMYSMLGHFGRSRDMMDLFARSWALKAMNENPDVTQVDIEVTQNYIPTMNEYRQGKRIYSEFLYRTTFTGS
jgi:hypothetical protein